LRSDLEKNWRSKDRSEVDCDQAFDLIGAP
jgi:hypothetical protein